MEKQKRALAVHDISCVGRCSLTVALPILSAAGVETAVLPTAVLSTHTGGFQNYTYRDLTEDVAPIAAHWVSLGLTFDAIYTGYLGSFAQIELVQSLFAQFRGPDTLILVDPVMADNGVLYPGFAPDFPKGMKGLCANANVIVPNLTEATLMLEEPYLEGPYTKDYIEGLLRRLAAIGPDQVVLTGVHFDTVNLGAAAYDRKTDTVSYAFAEWVEGYYHGTGDVFGSALGSALLCNFPMAQAVRVAVNYTRNCIALTAQAKTEPRYGVCFEKALPNLLRELALI